MKKNLKMAVVAVIALAGLSGVAVAATSYYPPERLHCKVDKVGKLSCADFNHEYLAEATYTADFPAEKDVVFTFAWGSAFVTSTNEWGVFYTYKDSNGKNIRLKTINTAIHPDFQHGEWSVMRNYYLCTAGYMSCPITDSSAS